MLLASVDDGCEELAEVEISVISAKASTTLTHRNALLMTFCNADICISHDFECYLRQTAAELLSNQSRINLGQGVVGIIHGLLILERKINARSN